MDTLKTCTACHQALPLDRFSIRKRTGKPIPTCKACVVSKVRAWQKEHAQHVKAYRHDRYERRKLSRQAVNRPWSLCTPAQRKARTAAVRKWRMEHRDTDRMLDASYKRIRRHLLFRQHWQTIVSLYGNRCLCCGASGVVLCCDHVVPLLQGGASRLIDLQPLCRACNARKRGTCTDYRPDHGHVIRTTIGLDSTLPLTGPAILPAPPPAAPPTPGPYAALCARLLDSLHDCE